MPRYKYTKELLEAAVASSESIYQVLVKLGVPKTSGGAHTHIKMQLRRLGIDTSHFLGQAINRGKVFTNKRKSAEVILTKRDDGRRVHANILKRAMLESGVLHVCSVCKTPPIWRGKPLTLQIDHKSGDFTDNRIANVQFVCPNCHSQTETFGNKSKRSSKAAPTTGILNIDLTP